EQFQLILRVRRWQGQYLGFPQRLLRILRRSEQHRGQKQLLLRRRCRLDKYHGLRECVFRRLSPPKKTPGFPRPPPWDSSLAVTTARAPITPSLGAALVYRTQLNPTIRLLARLRAGRRVSPTPQPWEQTRSSPRVTR